MGYSHNFFQILFRDNFPKDYFTFILRLMQLLRAFAPIKKIKLEIQTIGTPLPLGSPSKFLLKIECFKKRGFFFSMYDIDIYDLDHILISHSSCSSYCFFSS